MVGGSIYSYYGIGNGQVGDGGWATNTIQWSSRGVVIVGSGLLYKRSKSFILEEKYLRIFLKVEYKRSIIPSVKKR